MSIRAKILLPMVLIILIMFGYYHLSLVPQIRNEILQEFIYEQEEVSKTFETAIEILVDEQGNSSLNKFIQSEKKNHPYWQSVTFTPLDGSISLSSTNGSSLTIAELDSNQLEITIPVKPEINTIGSIIIIADGEPFIERQTQNALRLEKPFFLSLCLIIAYTLFVIQASIYKPIKKMVKTLRSISGHEYGQSLKFGRKDEIGELAINLDRMRVAVTDYEKRIEFKRKLFNEIVDSLDDAILIIDRKNKVISSNPAANRILSIIGINEDSFDDVIQSFNPIDQANIERLLDGDCNKDEHGKLYESSFQISDSDSMVVSYAVKPIINGNERVSVIRIRDISASKKVENQILNQRQQIATINQAQANYIASGDPMELFDGLLPDLLELAESEHGFIAQVVNEEDTPRFLRVFTNLSFPWDCVTSNLYVGDENSILEIHDFDPFVQNIFDRKEPIISNSSDKISFAIGSEHVHSILGMPLTFSDQIVGILVLVNKKEGYDDSTVDALEPFLNICSYLIDAIGRAFERKRQEFELRRAKDIAIAGTKAKSEFLATMSHELRTPMNGMLGMLQLLKRTVLDSKQKKYVDMALDSGEMLLSVINDILDFSKIEAGKLDLEIIPINISSLVEKISVLFMEPAQQKELELKCSISKDLPEIILGDPTRIRQVLANLLSNAIKFTEKGRVSILVESKDGEIVFTIEDTGIGITEAQQKKLFRAFSQVDSSHTRRFGGTGLGLVICHKLVGAMGGVFTVASNPGVGSAFTFRLPSETVDFSGDINKLMQFVTDLHVVMVDPDKKNVAGWMNTIKQLHIKQADTCRTLEQVFEGIESNDDSVSADLVIANVSNLMGEYSETDIVDFISSNRSSKYLLAWNELDIQARELNEKLRDSDTLPIQLPVNNSSFMSAICTLFMDEIDSYKTHITHNSKLCFNNQKLLLVEDNATNQLVAEELLLEAGFQVDICENGAKAVEAVKNNQYDMVLMDIQMPIMDGLEATKRIRAMGPPYSDLPIIAMTAHAAKDDSVNSFQSGMNAHITKPFNPIALMNTLAKYLETTELLEIEPENKDKDPSPEIEEIPGIDTLQGLQRMNGNTKAYKRVLVNFRQQNLQSVELLNTYLELDQWAECQALSHSLKGSSGNIGAADVYTYASALEQACKDFDKDKALDNLALLEQKLELVIDGLALVDISQATKEKNIQKSINDEQLLTRLSEIIPLLDEDLASAEDKLSELVDSYDGDKHSSSLDSASEHLQNYNVDEVRNLLTGIADSLQRKVS